MVIDAISFEQCDDQSQREHKQVQKNGQRKGIKKAPKIIDFKGISWRRRRDSNPR